MYELYPGGADAYPPVTEGYAVPRAEEPVTRLFGSAVGTKIAGELLSPLHHGA
jgi:hypothetical protein